MESDELEALAKILSSSPDYRILRRLKVKDGYAEPPANAPRATGIVIDTETTGLEASDAIVEFALVRFEFDPVGGCVYGIKDSYCALEDPGIRISEQSIAVHGITQDMVKGKRLDDSKVFDIIRNASLVIAHNARFDRPMVEKRFPQFAHLNWSCSYQEIDWKAAGFGGASLEHIAYRFGFFYEAHGAEMDCRALVEILNQSVRTITGNTTVIKQLLSAVNRVDERIWALNAPFDKKDLLKARGYRWNSENPKAWWIGVDRKDAFAERRWLMRNVYQANSATMRIDVIDASSRYSTRLTDSRTRRITDDGK